MKSKKKNNNRYKNNQDKVLKINYPRTFFRSIGIKPHVNANEEVGQHHFEKAILQKFGKGTLTLFQDALDAPDSGKIFDLCHTKLDFVKIWYGVDFYRTCLIANILQKIDIINNKSILDIGGGPGQLAFFMSRLWPDSNITVIDKYSHIGIEWADEINETRVNFKNGQLSDLKAIGECKYDQIIMSRVIGNLEGLSLPSYSNTFETSKYLQSQEGIKILSGLKKIGSAIANHLTEDGHLIIIDSWSGIRAILIATALEKNGLFVDIDHFDPATISISYSPIIFSKTRPVKSPDNLPLGLAVIADQKCDSPFWINNGQIAEVLRSLFVGSRIVFEDTFSIKTQNITFQQEVLEKNGLAIKYVSSSDGIRIAVIGSSVFIQFLIETCENDKQVLKSGMIPKKLNH
jgi:hypothetical protein